MSQGYTVKQFSQPTKRYVRTLCLKDDPQLIAEYRKRHSEEFHWPEIREGIQAVGILEMEIYILDTTLVMIVETSADLDLDAAMQQLATLPELEDMDTLLPLLEKAKQQPKTKAVQDAIDYAEMVVKYVSDGSGTMDMIQRATDQLKAVVK